MNKQHNKAIVLVYHGSTNEEVNQLTSTKLTNMIKKDFQNYDVLEVFSSKIVLHRLENKRLNYAQAALDLANNNYQEVVLVLLNLAFGRDNQIQIDEFKKYGYKLKVVKPIFESLSNLKYLARKLTRRDKEYNNIYIGHGSKHHSNESLLKLNQEFKNMGLVNYQVIVNQKDNFEANIQSLKFSKNQTIMLHPLTYVNNYHGQKVTQQYYDYLSDKGYNVIIDKESLGMQDYFNDLVIGMINDELE